MWLADNWQRILAEIVRSTKKAILEAIDNMLSSVAWWSILAVIVGTIVVALALPFIEAALAAGGISGAIIAVSLVSPVAGLAAIGGVWAATGGLFVASKFMK